MPCTFFIKSQVGGIIFILQVGRHVDYPRSHRLQVVDPESEPYSLGIRACNSSLGHTQFFLERVGG